MGAVLITGMSGAGKSTTLAALAALGHATVDTDEPGWIEVVDGEPLWRVERISAVLDEAGSDPLFIVGTVANQGRFAHRFAAVVLLTAPLEVLLERLRDRDTNTFGKSEVERAAVVRDRSDVEPRLRATATHVVDTREPVSGVVERLLGIAGRPAA